MRVFLCWLAAKFCGRLRLRAPGSRPGALLLSGAECDDLALREGAHGPPETLCRPLAADVLIGACRPASADGELHHAGARSLRLLDGRKHARHVRDRHAPLEREALALTLEPCPAQPRMLARRLDVAEAGRLDARSLGDEAA